MLIYIFLYMIGQQLNMGTTYWVLFWGCLTYSIVRCFLKVHNHCRDSKKIRLLFVSRRIFPKVFYQNKFAATEPLNVSGQVHGPLCNAHPPLAKRTCNSVDLP